MLNSDIITFQLIYRVVAFVLHSSFYGQKFFFMKK